MKTHVPRVAVGLVHYPIRDRAGKVVATNITNFDVHDIARACRVYGVEKYFLIHPMQEQLMFVSRILDHWRVGQGFAFNPKRKAALQNVETAKDVDEALRLWGVSTCRRVATHARALPGVPAITFKELRQELHEPGGEPVFLILGTGFGLTDEFMMSCDRLLEPIRGAPPDDFRHLSVRSAASICLDRLLGSY